MIVVVVGGVNRSGKSSIASVVFHKLPPQETLFLESTTRIQKDSIRCVYPQVNPNCEAEAEL